MADSGTNRYYLGVDGGASNITVVILDEKGNSVYEATSPHGANFRALSLDQAVNNLEESVREAVQTLDLRPAVFEKSVFGLAGCNFPSDEEMLYGALRKSALSTMLGGGFSVHNDSAVALRAGTDDGIGVVLIAGTGSNCFGRSASGETAKAGGLDTILSDEGSGYDIGIRSLQAVVQALDGRGEETALVQAIFNQLKVDSLQQLHDEVYAKYQTKAAIASLAKQTVEIAAKGDAVARDILNHSVNELLSMVDAVIRRLDWRDTAIPVIAVGSVVGHRNYVRQRFQSELLRVAPKAKLVTPKVSSANGAALLALEGDQGVGSK